MASTGQSSKRILVTLATGQQGRHTVEALARRNQDAGQSVYTILAVTRSAASSSAKRLAALPGVELIENDYVPSEIFAKATANGTLPLDGVFSVQAFMHGPKHVAKGVEGETQLGKQVVDEAKKHGVKHFVYTSVDQGGLPQTDVPHFESKRKIEDYLKETSLPWTILRPVAFMDNVKNGNAFEERLMNTFMTTLLKEKPLQLIAAKDIGQAAAAVFDKPETYAGKTISLAADEVTKEGIKETYQSVKGKPLPTTFSFLPWLIAKTSTEVTNMFRFFDTPGYKADIKETRALVPDALTFRQYVEQTL